ncbi:protease complex subunit PrcB family protein [Thermus thermamylovorans]|uniref:Protease complex subunit PrcB family protein n=1 Tax=Thermus thermamylovorans TaxID=2509362 RepID=A0A4Q9B3W1_9DEIN|nr:protease complex subunit PrcB family protein [Thermus thermamylovorans]TBH20610.1 protease complex subunit PrcB family protein [Thermus thermamylovorans]
MRRALLLLALLPLLAACQLLEGTGYRVAEAQLLFPEATERWTYFYGEPREVRLSGRTLRLEGPRGESLWAVPGALWVNENPFLREVAPSLRPLAEAVRGVGGSLVEVRAQAALRGSWLFDGVGWVRLTGGLRAGERRALVQPAGYTVPDLEAFTRGEAQVLLREVLARRGGRQVVLFELSEPVLRPLGLDPAPDSYRVGALQVQYGLRVEVVSPPAPPYRILDRGGNAAYGEAEARAFLANNPTRLAEVWNLAVGNRLPRPPAPSVDFRTRSVAAFFWGLKPTGGYGIEVVGVTYGGGAARVILNLQSPRPGAIVTQALTSPYVILELERVNRVVFADPAGRVLAEARE